MSAQHLTRDICLFRRDIVRTYIYLQGYMSALYPSSVFTTGDGVMDLKGECVIWDARNGGSEGRGRPWRARCFRMVKMS